MHELADAQTVRRWASGHGLNLSMATLRKFRRETGRGMTREALIDILTGTRMKPTLDDVETLTTNVPTDASIRAEAHVHLTNLLARCETPDSLGWFVREFHRYRALVDVERLAGEWTGAIEHMATLSESALSIAGDVNPACDDATNLTFEQALASRDRAQIARWGVDAREAARFSRLDLLDARGLLLEVPEETVVRPASLV